VAPRPVLLFPHPALKRVAEPVPEDGLAAAAQLADELLETMRSFPGCVGIAANQIGELARVIVVDLSEHPKAVDANHGLLQLVNPRISASAGADVGREGCLSIPDFTANVKRAETITLEALSPTGAALTIESTGFEARCLQHELDHLDGLLFLDRVESLRTDVFRRKQRSS
jgi:peptide deformylase